MRQIDNRQKVKITNRAQKPPKGRGFTAAPPPGKEKSRVPDSAEDSSEAPDAPPAPAGRIEPVRAEPKVGRNDPCPCGSGKKYKKCCLTQA